MSGISNGTQENKPKESSSQPNAVDKSNSKVIDVPITNAHLRAINAERIYNSRPIPQTGNEVHPKSAPAPLLSLVLADAPAISTPSRYPGGIFSGTLDDGRVSVREILSFLGWDANTFLSFAVVDGVLEVLQSEKGTSVIDRDQRMLLPLKNRRQLQIAPNARICLVAQKSEPNSLVIYPEHKVLALLERSTSK